MGAVRRVAASIVAVALLPAGASARAVERPMVTLYVDSRTDVPSRLLASARAEVEAVFHAAGVEIAWIEGPSPEPWPPLNASGSREVLVMLTTTTQPSCDGRCALGLAVHPRRTAFVFYTRILQAYRGLPVDLGVALGRVIAHEVGHLLLPPGTHSPYGIMRETIDVGFSNPNRFTKEEARFIRERLMQTAGS